MAEENYPGELRYHSEHGWARIEDGTATLGITWFAQDNLNEIVFLDPPKVGDRVTRGEPYAEIESVKAVSEVYAPLSGQVVQINSVLGESAGLVNRDPYGQGWLVRIELSDPGEADRLMSAQEYATMIRP